MELRSAENAWPVGDAGRRWHQKEGIIKLVVEKMEAQLEGWNAKIERLAARAQKAGDRARFEDLMHIDELKAFRAIAQSKLEELRDAQATERSRLEVEIETALEDLKAAFKNPKPSSYAVKGPG